MRIQPNTIGICIAMVILGLGPYVVPIILTFKKNKETDNNG